MSEEVMLLKARAEEARILYMRKEIGPKEAKKIVMEYIDVVNAKAEEIAKKYNMRPKKVSYAGFMR